uniref:Uncharacterized protein n=1 Tax=Opuntia streptacantha TaxID=393608 RepID=A0A7C9CL65_OPUST
MGIFSIHLFNKIISWSMAWGKLTRLPLVFTRLPLVFIHLSLVFNDFGYRLHITSTTLRSIGKNISPMDLSLMTSTHSYTSATHTYTRSIPSLCSYCICVKYFLAIIGTAKTHVTTNSGCSWQETSTLLSLVTIIKF